MAIGVQLVLIPWLAIDYLELAPSAVGLVQAAVFLPNLALLILGGISADRGGAFKQLTYLLLAYALVHGVLLVLLNQNLLVMLSLVVYSLLLGVVGAFVQPCKDYIVGLMASSQMQKTVAKTHLSQYTGQAMGIGFASLLYDVHLESLPLMQIVLLVLAALCLALINRNTSNEHELLEKKTTTFPSIVLLGSGFMACWRSPVLRTLITLVAFNGFFHVGVFIVALPLLAKTIYLGDIRLFSLLQGLFIAGSCASTLRIIIRGELDQPGQRVIFSVLYGGLILLGLGMGPTPTGMMVLICLWGCVVGASATLGRTILQAQATEKYRGRIISIYQLALFGCAPLGSLVAGIAIDYWNVLVVIKLSAMASFVFFGATFFTRSLWGIN